MIYINSSSFIDIYYDSNIYYLTKIHKSGVTINILLYSVSAKHLKVHVTDLAIPTEANKLRDLTVDHIEQLKKSLLDRPEADFTTLIVNIPDILPDAVDLQKTKEGDSYKMEVIGGLHTYHALLEILKIENYEDDNRFLFRNVRLYAGLNDVQCLKIGHDHNLIPQLHQGTSFEEYTLLFRKELLVSLGQPPDHQGSIPTMTSQLHKVWKDRLSAILNLKVQTKFRIFLYNCLMHGFDGLVDEFLK